MRGRFPFFASFKVQLRLHRAKKERTYSLFRSAGCRLLAPLHLLWSVLHLENRTVIFSQELFLNDLLLRFLHLRKEVIQPHLPIRLPCYDFTPVIGLTLDNALLAVRLLASGAPNSHGVTGGVYKARERIHRGMLIRDY